MEKIFQILAVIFAGIAAFFWWRGNTDGLFISAVFGAVCFFLGIRLEVGTRVEGRRGDEETGGQGDEEIGRLGDAGKVVDESDLPVSEILSEQTMTDEGQTPTANEQN